MRFHVYLRITRHFAPKLTVNSEIEELKNDLAKNYYVGVEQQTKMLLVVLLRASKEKSARLLL